MVLSEAGRGDHELAANFKPHVPFDPAAAGPALAFLRALRAGPAVRQELDPPASRVTVVGIPASWGEDAARRVVSIVGEAGFPEPRALPEPVGALFFYLATRLRAEDLRRDTLVIDWGAGTCDFTLMRGGRPVPEGSWGSGLFGGRLFDDLVYRWFLEQVARSPERAAELAAVRDDPVLSGILREVRSREPKEALSVHMRQRRGPFRSRIVEVGEHGLGRLVVGDRAEFEARARG